MAADTCPRALPSGPLQLFSGPGPTSAKAPPRIGERQEDSGARKSGRAGVLSPGGPPVRSLSGSGQHSRLVGAAAGGSGCADRPRRWRQGVEPTNARLGTMAGWVPVAALGRGALPWTGLSYHLCHGYRPLEEGGWVEKVHLPMSIIFTDGPPSDMCGKG
ncbi:hypothetical protein NDU88_004566 [Pleurodeles waltl]|uniref:Uncharacterized protein n=1 Tax=Pleurodeles waltl TaxID=8319 RepID=A0AAV7VKP0_PLEWA|nr:hypothetical protein NDU88_004566 [Pleurodeles waltl]